MLMMDFINLTSFDMFMIGSLLLVAFVLLIIYIFLNIQIKKVIDVINLSIIMDLTVTANKRLARKTSAHASVALLDQDVLECPICCEPLKIPIFQCINGHLACTPCWKKGKNICPSCQKPVKYEFRCRAMEKVVEAARVSCPNAGCKKNISYTNLSSHEGQCVFAQFYSPIRDCNYSCLSKDLFNHVRANHRAALRGL
ncbi:unnamed protein product [Arabidopsis halleri]